MNLFFTPIRRRKKSILKEFANPMEYCSTLASDIDGVDLPKGIEDLLNGAQPDEFDYAVSSAYALLMDTQQRTALSVFFTPTGFVVV